MSDKPKGRYHSTSSTEMYLDCPQAYYLRYVRRVERDEREVPVHWRLGTVVHGGLQAAYEALREAGAQPQGATMDVFWPAASEAIDRLWKELDMPTTHGDLDWCKEVTQRTLAKLGVPHPTQVVLIEDQLVEQTDDGVIVHGFVDLGLLLNLDEIRIRDWKVTSNAHDSGMVARSPQLNLYAWLARRRWPHVQRVYIEEYYPPLQRAVTVMSDPEVEAEVVEQIEVVAEMIEEASAEGNWPTKVGERCETCPFRKQCPAWTSDERVEARSGLDGF